MKKNDSTDRDISIKDFPDNLTLLFKELLDTKNSGKKLQARTHL
jgi:hypothetical protein